MFFEGHFSGVVNRTVLGGQPRPRPSSFIYGISSEQEQNPVDSLRNRTEQDRTGQDRTGQDRTGQNRTEQILNRNKQTSRH